MVTRSFSQASRVQASKLPSMAAQKEEKTDGLRLCLRYGDKLLLAYQTTRQLELSYADRKLLRELEDTWAKTRAQLKLLSTVLESCANYEFSERLQTRLIDTTKLLQRKLEEATIRTEMLRISMSARNQRTTWIAESFVNIREFEDELFGCRGRKREAETKQALGKLLAGLREWHATFDSYFVQLARSPIFSTPGTNEAGKEFTYANSALKVPDSLQRLQEDILVLAGVMSRDLAQLGLQKRQLSRRESVISLGLFRKPSQLMRSPSILLLKSKMTSVLPDENILLHVPAAGLERCPCDDNHSSFRVTRARPTKSIDRFGRTMPSFSQTSAQQLIVTETIVLGASGEFIEPRLKSYQSFAARLQGLDPANSGILPCTSITTNAIPDGTNAKSFLNHGSAPHPMQSGRFSIQLSSSYLLHQSSSDNSLPFKQADIKPLTLRQLLVSDDSRISLRTRLRIAQNMSKSILTLYSLGITHGNVTPDSFLLFQTGKNSKLDGPYLQNFQLLHLQFAFSNVPYGKHIPWSYFLYLHPSRHYSWADYPAGGAHAFAQDIYSLGVLLLELGLWSSLAHLADTPTSPYATSTSSKTRGKWIPGKYLSRILLAQDSTKASNRIKNKELRRKITTGELNIHAILTQLCERKLEASMGKTYMEVVKSCLGVVELFPPEVGARGNSLHQITETRKSGERPIGEKSKMDIGVWYVEKVVEKLRESVVNASRSKMEKAKL